MGHTTNKSLASPCTYVHGLPEKLGHSSDPINHSRTQRASQRMVLVTTNTTNLMYFYN